MESKKEIRQKIYLAREQMRDADWKEKSETIAGTVISHPWFENAADIYAYIDYRHEAGTRSIIEEAWKRDKRVWVPKVTGSAMCFCQIRSFKELRPGAHGIPEPEILPENEDCRIENIRRDKDGCRLMIMPGVAFDRYCGRIGYGGGYYDRYLADHPDIHTIAIAFDFQIFQEVPREEHDICPEILVTESKTLCRQPGYMRDAATINCLKGIDYEYDKPRHQFI